MAFSGNSLRYIARVAALLAAGAIARADDEDHLAKAPDAVQATVKKILGSGKLEGFDPAQVDGKPAFDVDLSIGGTSYGLMVDPQGTVLQYEVEVNTALVPPVVIAAGTATHPDGKLGEASVITRGDKMFYELEIHVGKDEHDVELGADGKVMTDTIAPPEAPEAGEAAEKPEAGEKKD